MSLLHFLLLFFEHFGVILEDVRENGRRHGDIEKKAKKFLFHLYIVNLGTITGFLNKFNRTSKTQF